MTRRGNALSANDGQRRKIVAVARFRVAGMQAHAHPHRADLAPALAVERALRVQGRACGVAGIFEHRAERIAHDLEHVATVRVYRALEQRVMACLRFLHRIGMLLDQSRRALDVGKKKGYGAGWKRLHRESGDKHGYCRGGYAGAPHPGRTWLKVRSNLRARILTAASA